MPAAMGQCDGVGATGKRATQAVWHGVSSRAPRFGQNKEVLGGNVSEEIEITESDSSDVNAASTELLVEEVSIDGLCGVY